MKDKHFFYRMRRIAPRVFFFSIVLYGGTLLPIILVWMFKIENYWFIALVWCLQLFYYYVVRNIGNELYWISRALIKPEDLQACREEAELYEYVNSFLKERLKYEMTFNDILEQAEKDNKDGWLSYNCLQRLRAIRTCYFENQKKKIAKFAIKGFGQHMPTPKFIFEFRNNKLIYWQNTAWFSFSWI